MYEFMSDPEWKNLDEETKQGVIVLSFKKEIVADPEWGTIPSETQLGMRNLYFENAEQADTIASAPADRGFLGDIASRLARGGGWFV